MTGPYVLMCPLPKGVLLFIKFRPGQTYSIGGNDKAAKRLENYDRRVWRAVKAGVQWGPECDLQNIPEGWHLVPPDSVPPDDEIIAGAGFGSVH